MAETATLTLTDFLLARIAEDEESARAASPSPWFFDGYSTVFSGPMVKAHEDFWGAIADDDPHTYDHRLGETCPGCGERPAIYGENAKPEVRGQRFGTYWDCARHSDAYKVEPWVAREADLDGGHVPASSRRECSPRRPPRPRPRAGRV
jgi:hypothetical protein